MSDTTLLCVYGSMWIIMGLAYLLLGLFEAGARAGSRFLTGWFIVLGTGVLACGTITLRLGLQP